MINNSYIVIIFNLLYNHFKNSYSVFKILFALSGFSVFRATSFFK